ncbi:MAG: NAD+ synthase [Planctomycetota bacterium]
MGLELNCELATELLTRFIAEETKKVSVSKGVVGVSGGVDSATSLLLAARALGKKKVLALCMPYRSSSPDSLAHAKMVARVAGCPLEVVEITPQVDAYFANFPDADNVRRGNKMARERMSILYDFSKREDSLVIGTSNKTELLLGYGTLFGDMASAINPIGDLYKTQVRQLARHLGVPAEIVGKVPTADLWAGQSDEEELGFTYDEVDKVLYRYVDQRAPLEEIIREGFDAAFVKRIHAMVQRSHFKRRLPVIAKLSSRTIDRDFRYSRDWGH